MLEKLKEIIAEKLNLDEAEITEDSKFIDDLGADSLDLFDMVMSLEDEFGVEISTDDLEKIITVKDIMEYITNQQNEAQS